MSLTTAEQLRACHVKRWHIVQTAREQTLAEHSFAVAVLTGSLAASMEYKGLLHHGRQLELLQYALSHDLIEVRTGHIPTPFKRYLETAGGGPGIVERAEDLVDPDHCGAMRTVEGTAVESIVKLADLIEAIYFLQDNGLGAHAKVVLDGLRENLSKATTATERKHPELKVRAGVRAVCNEIGIMGGWL